MALTQSALLAKETTAASLSSALQLKVILSWLWTLFRPVHGTPPALTIRGRSAAMAQEKKMVWCMVKISMIYRLQMVRVADDGIGNMKEVKRKYWRLLGVLLSREDKYPIRQRHTEPLYHVEMTTNSTKRGRSFSGYDDIRPWPLAATTVSRVKKVRPRTHRK